MRFGQQCTTYCQECYQTHETICRCNRLLSVSLPPGEANSCVCMVCLEKDPEVLWEQRLHEVTTASTSVKQSQPLMASKPKSKPKKYVTPAPIQIEHFPSPAMPPEAMEMRRRADVANSNTRKRHKQEHIPNLRVTSKQPDALIPSPIKRRNSHLAGEVLHCSPKDSKQFTHSRQDVACPGVMIP